MYKFTNSHKNRYKQLQNTPSPAFIQRIKLHTPSSSSLRKKYVISMDGEKFYLVRSNSLQSAVQLTMDIGKNPDTRTRAPLSPGKTDKKPKKKSNSKELSRMPYGKTEIQKSTVLPIRKKYAMRLVNNRSTTALRIHLNGGE